MSINLLIMTLIRKNQQYKAQYKHKFYAYHL